MIYNTIERLLAPLDHLMQRFNLQTKLIVAILLSLLVGILLTLLIILIQINSALQNRLIIEGKRLHRDASYAVAYGLSMEDETLVSSFLDGIYNNEKLYGNLVAIELRTIDGRVFASRSRINIERFDEYLAEMRDQVDMLEDKEDVVFKPIQKYLVFFGSSYYYETDGSKDLIGYIRVILDATSLRETKGKIFVTSVLLSLFPFLFGTAIAILLGQRIIRPIRSMKIKMEAISKGDANLAERLEIDSADEIGEMAHAFNLFLDKLNRVILDIRDTSEKIGIHTNNINQNITSIATKSSSQASYVHDTTTSVQQLSGAAKSISEDAAQVLLISNTSYSSAMRGVNAVAESRSQMREIQSKNKQATSEIINLGKKSREIERIMQLISGISVQSKIIAFNAAIEAAISGPIGQRFGAVASQIRELTVTVLDSTDEIKQILTEVQNAVEELIKEFIGERESIQDGVRTIEEAMEVLQAISNESEQIVRMMKQISTSTQQQTSASELVADSLQDILDEANAFREQSAKAENAVSEINHLSKTLLREVDRFKVKQLEPEEIETV